MSIPQEQLEREEAASGDGCGLCGAVTGADEDGAPYIICQPCHNRLISVSSSYKKQLDELPFGVIDLDPQGEVIAYNRTEAELARVRPEHVVGRNFFTEVAPCTSVRGFRGRFNEFMLGDEQVMRFYFTFSFRHGPVEVEIFFLRGSPTNNLGLGERQARVLVKRRND